MNVGQSKCATLFYLCHVGLSYHFSHLTQTIPRHEAMHESSFVETKRINF